jgi:hypothetical protein
MRAIFCDHCNAKIKNHWSCITINAPVYILGKKGKSIDCFSPDDDYEIHFCKPCYELFLSSYIDFMDTILSKK